MSAVICGIEMKEVPDIALLIRATLASRIASDRAHRAPIAGHTLFPVLQTR